MIVWIGFIALICGLLALDLGVLNREAHVVSTREALGWTSIWITLSLLFGGFVYFAYKHHWLGIGETIGTDMTGGEAFVIYLTGYLIEQSLSIDNVFVIAIIFNYFRIPNQYQHRVLFWGIVGAIVFRGIMIVAGTYLLQQFNWITYVFGAILLYSAYRMFKHSYDSVDPESNKVVNYFKKIFPVVNRIEGESFFVIENGVRAATPLFIALLVIETTDVMFAFDSIPAIFAITRDPFIVFTSNIFAILGLRSLYFVLAAIIGKFRYLQYSLVLILALVGVKMILLHYVHFPAWVSLLMVAVILGGGIIASLIIKPKKEEEELPEQLEKKEVPKM